MSNKKSKNTIGIDARFYGPVGKGLGRYTQEIVDRVIKIDEENDYVIFLCRENYETFVVPRSGVKKVLVKARWYTLKEQIMLPFLIWREGIDLMHFTHFNVPILTPTRFIVTIHDLILTKFPTVRASTLSPWIYKLKNFFYKIVIWTAVKRARKIIAVSEFTKQDIIHKFKVRPERVVMIYEGVSGNFQFSYLRQGFGGQAIFNFQLADANVSEINNEKLESGRPNSQFPIPNSQFLLYVGNAYPHKNLEGLIKIMPGLREKFPDLKLVLVGKEDYFYKRVKDFARSLNLFKEGDDNSPVIFPGFVPDEDLKNLFASASAYVFASFYEGFGLPPLEAMSQGCPVASSKESCLPEVLGQAGLYFDPRSEDDMIEKISQLLSDEKLRADLIRLGYEQAKKYSWDKAVRETVEVYRGVVSS